MYKVIFFDQDDTLCPAKNKADTQMIALLEKLLREYRVVIISGGMFDNIDYQVLSEFTRSAHLENLTLFPTCATRMVEYDDGQWREKYSMMLQESEVDFIKQTFEIAIDQLDLKPEKVWGEIIENRGSQVTYSALGQKAPLEAKRYWDSDKQKRKMMVDFVADELVDFSLGIGGTTSIDIMKKGIDKSYGVEKMIELYQLAPTDILYVGDALFPGGNDHVVVKTGIDTHQVENPEDTKKIIQKLLHSV